MKDSVEIFNKAYNVSGTFRFTELFEACLREFGHVGFDYFESRKLPEQLIPEAYSCGVGRDWETYEFDGPITTDSAKDSFIRMFIERKENIKFQKIVKEVYV